MVDSTGFGETAANEAVTNIISGGATVHLLGGGDTMSYSDTGTEVSNKSDAEVSVAEADFTITAATGFSDVTTLENDNELDFGTQDIGTVDEIVIQNDADTDLWIVADEPNNPDLTGEDVTIAAGTTLYELGNPT